MKVSIVKVKIWNPHPKRNNNEASSTACLGKTLWLRILGLFLLQLLFLTHEAKRKRFPSKHIQFTRRLCEEVGSIFCRCGRF
ncbi:unnamed protein product [Urochloa humidicola]